MDRAAICTVARPSEDEQDSRDIALTYRERGNNFFKEQKFEDAAACYEEAMGLLLAKSDLRDRRLLAAIRLNLAASLTRLGRDLPKVVDHCSTVLADDPENAKALFRRGVARHLMSLDPPESCRDDKRTLLLNARKDLLKAGRLEPTDRQVRSTLGQVNEALSRLPPPQALASEVASSTSSSDPGNAGLRGAFSAGSAGLYEDRLDDIDTRPADSLTDQPRVPPLPAVVCSTCGLWGHPRCGKAWWLEQRAHWLGVDLDIVANDPPDFEDNGTLLEAVRNIRRAAGRCVTASEDRCIDEELSDSEREMLEDCLESTERPYPQLKRRLPLALAVHCAEELWAEC